MNYHVMLSANYNCATSNSGVFTRVWYSVLMSYQDRQPLIEELQKARGGTVVLSYVTSTRVGLESSMGMDAIRKIHRQLEAITAKPKDTTIDLFIHSNGGDGTVPWRLVTLIREYCKEFNVLVPYKAFSAATLTALGADNIYMHRMGMLGPTDPKVSNEFNPNDPNNPQQKIGINVEDVFSYISLIKEDVGITHEDELIQAWSQLASENRIHPLALGNVKRFYSQSRMMAIKLLQLHMDKGTDNHRIKEIADNLNSKLYFHGHPINREEARELELKVINPTSKVEAAMWTLYESYEAAMKLEEPFNPIFELKAVHPDLGPLGQNAKGQVVDVKDLIVACVESINGSNELVVDVHVEGYRVFGNGMVQEQVNFNQTRQKWVSV